MKIVQLLILLLLVVFPFGELLRFDLGNNVRFKPLDIIALVLCFYWFILLIKKKIKITSISWYYLIFPLVGAISLLINTVWLMPNELFASVLYLIRWLSYAGIFFLLTELDSGFKNKIITILLIDGVIIVFLGYLQYFFFSDLKPLYYLGWDDHMYRMFSVFLDPNYTGAFFVLYLLLCLGLFSTYWKSDKKKNRKKLILLGFIAAATLLALFLTFSRSSLLMLIGGVSVFFILIGRKKFILLLFAVIFIFTLLISSKFNVENMNLFRQASSSARISNYQNAVTILNGHPVLGVGFNTYRYAKDRYAMQMGWVNAPSHADAGVDNSFLFILVTTGIVGFAAYVLLWWFILKRAFIYYKKQSNIFAIILIASSAGLFIHAMFINSLFFPAIMVWMWMLVGLMESKTH